MDHLLDVCFANWITGATFGMALLAISRFPDWGQKMLALARDWLDFRDELKRRRR